MTRVIIVGDVYYADLYPGGGPMPGGGAPVDPGYGRPEGPGRPDHIWGQRPPHVGGGPVQPPHYPTGGPVPPGGPVDPGYGRPGGGGGNYPSTGPIYGGGHPGGGPMPGGERPDNTLPEALPEGWNGNPRRRVPAGAGAGGTRLPACRLGLRSENDGMDDQVLSAALRNKHYEPPRDRPRHLTGPASVRRSRGRHVHQRLAIRLWRTAITALGLVGISV